ncbi:MAG: RNA polymerase sigma factor [Hyphococcus sp.]|nr:MAG: RNA polymerase sigma factor [Marinicaulis sp.]
MMPDDKLSNVEDPIGAHRGRLMGLAYRMLGSMTDAEDVLQDAYLRYASADISTIRSKEAFLVTIVTRLCLDRLKSAKTKREVYIGPWLPEPTPDADALSPQTALELADDLSFALLLTLERLSGQERAAFLLHDVFDRPYSEIATALGKSEAGCRQLASRARKAVHEDREPRASSPDQHQLLLQRFMEAAASGDAGRLQALLTDDAIAYSDGGGVRIAALNPVIGADKVARFFVGLMKKGIRENSIIRPVIRDVNGAPGLLVYVDEELDNVLSLELKQGKISTIFVVRNPEKLHGLAGGVLN